MSEVRDLIKALLDIDADIAFLRETNAKKESEVHQLKQEIEALHRRLYAMEEEIRMLKWDARQKMEDEAASLTSVRVSEARPDNRIQESTTQFCSNSAYERPGPSMRVTPWKASAARK